VKVLFTMPFYSGSPGRQTSGGVRLSGQRVSEKKKEDEIGEGSGGSIIRPSH